MPWTPSCDCRGTPPRCWARDRRETTACAALQNATAARLVIAQGSLSSSSPCSSCFGYALELDASGGCCLQSTATNAALGASMPVCLLWTFCELSVVSVCRCAYHKQLKASWQNGAHCAPSQHVRWVIKICPQIGRVSMPRPTRGVQGEAGEERTPQQLEGGQVPAAGHDKSQGHDNDAHAVLQRLLVQQAPDRSRPYTCSSNDDPSTCGVMRCMAPMA